MSDIRPEPVSRRALGSVNQRGTQLFAVMLTFLVVAWAFIGMRIYVRLFMIKKMAVDDWIMIAAVLVYTGYGIIAIWGIVAGGTGEHSVQLTPEGASIALEAWYLCEVVYAPLSALVRTSIAIFLLCIAQRRIHKCIIYGNLVVIWVLSITYLVLILLQCSPPSYFWEQVVGGQGSCINTDIVPGATIAHSVISASSDFILALLPIPILWNVQLNKGTKVTIAIFLGMGLFAGIVLIVRIPYVKFLAVSTDFLYQTIDVAIWSVMEPSLGIIAGCAATLRPLIKAWGFGLGGSSRRYPRYGGSNPRPKTLSNNILGDMGASPKVPSSGWRLSRGVQKLEDDGVSTQTSPTLVARPLGTKSAATRKSDGTFSSDANSDIELVNQGRYPTAKTRSTRTGSSGNLDPDIEHEAGMATNAAGHRAGLASPGRGAVHVETSIDIEILTRNLSGASPDGGELSSASSRTFPLQGERTITINGPDGEGGLFSKHVH